MNLKDFKQQLLSILEYNAELESIQLRIDEWEARKRDLSARVDKIDCGLNNRWSQVEEIKGKNKLVIEIESKTYLVERDSGHVKISNIAKC